VLKRASTQSYAVSIHDGSLIKLHFLRLIGLILESNI